MQNLGVEIDYVVNEQIRRDHILCKAYIINLGLSVMSD